MTFQPAYQLYLNTKKAPLFMRQSSVVKIKRHEFEYSDPFSANKVFYVITRKKKDGAVEDVGVGRLRGSKFYYKQLKADVNTYLTAQGWEKEQLKANLIREYSSLIREYSSGGFGEKATKATTDALEYPSDKYMTSGAVGAGGVLLSMFAMPFAKDIAGGGTAVIGGVITSMAIMLGSAAGMLGRMLFSVKEQKTLNKIGIKTAEEDKGTVLKPRVAKA